MSKRRAADREALLERQQDPSLLEKYVFIYEILVTTWTVSYVLWNGLQRIKFIAPSPQILKV